MRNGIEGSKSPPLKLVKNGRYIREGYTAKDSRKQKTFQHKQMTKGRGRMLGINPWTAPEPMLRLLPGKHRIIKGSEQAQPGGRAAGEGPAPLGVKIAIVKHYTGQNTEATAFGVAAPDADLRYTGSLARRRR